jgi:hypothetical protein
MSTEHRDTRINIFDGVIRREDDVTRILRNLMQFAPVRRAVGEAISHGLHRPINIEDVPIDRIETHSVVDPEGGCPDLVIRGKDFILLVEIKVGSAKLTERQKNGYVDALAELALK